MKLKTEDIVSDIREWSIDRIHYLAELSEDCEDSAAIYNEFKEWIDPKIDDIEILSLDES